MAKSKSSPPEDTGKTAADSVSPPEIDALRQKFLGPGKKLAVDGVTIVREVAPRTAREIVQAALPHMEIVDQVEQTDQAQVVHVDNVSPDIAELRRKYFGTPGAASDHLPDAAIAPVGDDQGSGIVMVVPKDRPAGEKAPAAKAVVVAEGKIIGFQG